MAAITKAELYITILFIVGMFSFLVFSIGSASLNSDTVTLDNKSKDYIAAYSVQYNEAGFGDIADEEIGETAREEILTGNNETGEVIATDNFAIPKFNQGALAEVPNKFKMVYNIPSLVLTGMNMNIKDWSGYINIFGWTVAICLLYVFIKSITSGGQT